MSRKDRMSPVTGRVEVLADLFQILHAEKMLRLPGDKKIDKTLLPAEFEGQHRLADPSASGDDRHSGFAFRLAVNSRKLLNFRLPVVKFHGICSFS